MMMGIILKLIGDQMTQTVDTATEDSITTMRIPIIAKIVEPTIGIITEQTITFGEILKMEVQE